MAYTSNCDVAAAVYAQRAQCLMLELLSCESTHARESVIKVAVKLLQ